VLDKIKIVTSEIIFALESSDYSQITDFTKSILSADRIITVGAGRVGLAMQSFSMRLNHLGLTSYFIGSSNIPRTGSKDLLLVGSGSGNTSTIVTLVKLAKQYGLDVVCITANPNSYISESSSSLILLNCQAKEINDMSRTSLQPMTALFEQSLFIFLDSLVLSLMQMLKESHDSMLKRHNNLE
jgi:6-phospho-3-hexuloisomerase